MNPSFNLPQDEKTPVIMVGPGTGVAPMRGFIQERVAKSKEQALEPTMYLLFGCRNSQEILYDAEFKQYEETGLLKRFTALSREPETMKKTYVQDMIGENADLFAELILQKNAKILLCGDSSRMAPAVKSAFGTILDGRLSGVSMSGHEYVQQMLTEKIPKTMRTVIYWTNHDLYLVCFFELKEGRYSEDVYASQSL